MDIYKSASDDYKEKANEEKIVLYGKEEQCHNPCGFVNDIYIIYTTFLRQIEFSIFWITFDVCYS